MTPNARAALSVGGVESVSHSSSRVYAAQPKPLSALKRPMSGVRSKRTGTDRKWHDATATMENAVPIIAGSRIVIPLTKGRRDVPLEELLPVELLDAMNVWRTRMQLTGTLRQSAADVGDFGCCNVALFARFYATHSQVNGGLFIRGFFLA
mmetsp:Transcript_31125/g.57513  ORF Transcript_31125/g.57513 Transcript_31125/m.57513 type:complete len:151 (+) Transcript_31125:666-1118(+)